MNRFTLDTEQMSFDGHIREDTGEWQVDYNFKAKGVKGTFFTPKNWKVKDVFDYINQMHKQL